MKIYNFLICEKLIIKFYIFKATLTTVPFDCEFTFKIAGGRNVTVVLENATSVEIIFEIESSDSRCTFDDTIHITAKTTQHTALYDLDFISKSPSNTFDQF